MACPEVWLLYPMIVHWRKLICLFPESQFANSSSGGLEFCVCLPFSTVGLCLVWNYVTTKVYWGGKQTRLHSFQKYDQ